MYFSRIRINQESSNLTEWVRLVKGDIYNAHQLLWKLFPNQENRSFLFHQELYKNSLKDNFLSSQRNLPIFYMVSAAPPQKFSNLFIIETKSYAPILLKKQTYSFALRANPVVTIKREGLKNSAHHDILTNAKKNFQAKNGIETGNAWPEMEKAALNWLLSRALNWGFSVIPHQILIDSYQHHYLTKKREKKPIQFSTVDYSGILTVEDPAQFQQTLYTGVGRAKAFGCGLILIRPLTARIE
jgi:CRISPR system Cascade subunit CasE